MNNVRQTVVFVMTVTFIIIVGIQSASAEFDQHIVSDTFGGALFHDTIDFDNDGDFDVVASGRSPGQLVWFENIDFNFSMHVIATVSNPSRVRVCDIDEDGDNDVFAAFDLAQDSYEWWENLNDGTFAHHYLDTYAYDARNLDFGDLDLDGDIDIVGAGGGDLTVYWNDGEENFTEDNIAWYNGAAGLKVRDMDGDGYLDIVCAAFNEDEVGLWLNNGNSTFTYSYVGYVNDPHYLDIYDINGDGDLDVITTDTNAGLVYYYENNGLTFASNTVFSGANSPRSLVAGDFNQDGYSDIAFCEYSGDRIILLTNDGDENFSMSILDGVVNGATDIETHDFDLDGVPDLTCTAYNGGDVFWYENTFEALITIEATPHEYPILIPAEGGHFTYDILITNTLNNPHTGNIWASLEDPDGDETVVSPVFTGMIYPNQDREYRNIMQTVPADADPGDYIYRVNLGYYPDVCMYDEIEFSKEDEFETGGIVFGWNTYGFDSPDSENPGANGSEIPSDYLLEPAYPNPFNPSTTIHLNLPQSSDLSVRVFDISGRQVAVLGNGVFSAGRQAFTFSDEKLSSGVYLIRATVPSQMDQVQKVILVR